MCLGHTHALSGAVAGLAVGLFVKHMPESQLAIFTGLTAGAAVLPDIDHPNSSLAHCFGFFTKAVAWLIGRISGGHRHLTHAIFGVAGFTILAWLAVKYRHELAGRIGLGIFLVLIIASGLYAFGIRGHAADVLAIVGAILLVGNTIGLPLIALAVGVGCATHVVGDMLTDEGCPLLFPLSSKHFHLLSERLSFTTGTRPELWVLDPALAVGFAALLYRAYELGVIKFKFH
ncbi:MAG TPA: metal-dependent hydrolase [Streptosporangiaceae bacterium]|nr:metal-dependent hydrolase [Streptosporangiaceae bacterium]